MTEDQIQVLTFNIIFSGSQISNVIRGTNTERVSPNLEDRIL